MVFSEKRLILFDIDGTLLTSGGAGEAALCDAMRERFGVDEDLRGIVLAGATDRAIASEMLLRRGIPDSPENIAGLLDSYLYALESRVGSHEGRLMPGVLELLEALHGREDCVLGLLTGNLERGAQIKLTHYRLWHFFEFGAFADDHHDRNLLGPVAKSRAAGIHGVEFPGDRTYVIGDTPRDVRCGKAFGAKTVAVATGNYSLEDLMAEGPDFIFKDLSQTWEIVAVLTRG